MIKSFLLPAALTASLLQPLHAERIDMREQKVLHMLFHEETAKGRWNTVNDTVMGGVSSSRYQLTEDGTFIFRGNLSLENNGGFASVRSQLEPMDLDGADAFRLRVKGDGHRYQLRFSVDGEWRWVSYTQGFETNAGEWMEVELPVDQFRATFRGRSIPQAPAFDPANASWITLMATDKQEGEFELEVDRISAVFHLEPAKDAAGASAEKSKDVTPEESGE